ncbi:hypothetical protein ANMWB30_24620 [Arthrobacter sp. MWB30]|nr:hypothetical protein ANMWB30_24620 [Arthrobacter sp. MWB30]
MSQETTPAQLILGVCGYKGSGKSTMGDYLATHHGFTHVDLGSSGSPSATPDTTEGEQALQTLESLLKDALSRRESLVITGLRHRAEADMLQLHGGTIIRVIKPRVGGEFINIDADHIVLNEGVLDDLCIKTKQLLGSIRDQA